MENSAPAQAASSPEFLFTSGQGTLSATDLGLPITTPACEWPLLEQQIADALAAASAAGQANPCLSVPSRSTRRRPPASMCPVTMSGAIALSRWHRRRRQQR